MWFKNLRIYRLHSELDQEQQLEKLLQAQLFQPCGKMDPVKYGWAAPLGRNGKSLTHSVLGSTMFCAKRQEKILPSPAIKEALENKIYHIQQEEGRPVGRKERTALKEDIIFSLLPKALTKTNLEFGYASSQDKLVIVNSASSTKAETFLTLLRDSISSLKVVPLRTHHPIPVELSQWLINGKLPPNFELGENCELRADKDERVIRFRKQDLTASEVLHHLKTGMHVKRISLIWRESIEFTIDDEFALKSLKYSDKLLEKIEQDETDSAEAVFDSEFALMVIELNNLIKDLLQAFGGDSEVF